MECEICGREIYGKPNRSIVEGAKLILCSECAQFASSSWKPEFRQPKPMISKAKNPLMYPQNIRKPSQASRELELVEDYSQRIRKGREKLNLSHEELSRKIGERVSVLQKLETGKMIPDNALVKKLENILRIKLLEQLPKTIDEEKSYLKGSHDLTLGDIAIIQKPKTEDTEEAERKQ